MNNTFQKSIRQYEIWLAELANGDDRSHVQRGRRPVIVVSNDTVNHYSPLITIIPITSRHKKAWYPTHVSFSSGKEKESMALCEQLLTVDRYCLLHKLSEISDKNDINAINRAILVQLNLAQ